MNLVNLRQLLQHHFGLALYHRTKFVNSHTVEVIIALWVGEFSSEHLFYKWDLLCSELEPSLAGGSWDIEILFREGMAIHVFTIKWPEGILISEPE